MSELSLFDETAVKNDVRWRNFNVSLTKLLHTAVGSSYIVFEIMDHRENANLEALRLCLGQFIITVHDFDFFARK